jgi:transcriptional regulator with XRE-family HTH domain
MVHEDDAARVLGREVRRARHAARLRQRDVAEQVGLSQPSISRLELGRGGSASLDTWQAVARAVHGRLDIDLISSDGGRSPHADRTTRCHRMITSSAQAGGWTGVTILRHDAVGSELETRLARPATARRGGPEVAVIHVWDDVTAVVGLIRCLAERLEAEASADPSGIAVGGLVIIPSTFANRRRISEVRSELRDAFPAFGADWYAALVNPNRPMPRRNGILWATADGDRLRPAPFLPGWTWSSAADRARFGRPPTQGHSMTERMERG